MTQDERERHAGKAMAKVEDGKVTVTVDCVTCGRMTIGPIELLHVRTLLHMLENIAEQLELPDAGVIHKKYMSGASEDVLRDGEKYYENLPVDPDGPAPSKVH